MNYWKGFMNWPLDKDWKCVICEGYFGLTWGLVHGECRCNQCHAIYQMRANDEKRTVLTIPRCLIKPAFVQAAKEFYKQTSVPIDEARKRDWINFGVPESEFINTEGEEEEKG